MMTRSKFLLFALTSLLCKGGISQNATITIKNKSDRHLNVKLMQGNERKNTVYKIDSVAPKGTLVFNVMETGFYYTKSRAVLYDKKDAAKNDTIYAKDRPMQLVSDKKRGYSNITIEFKIKEAKENGSVSITRKEFDN
jgi:hypothetical protein